MACIAVLAAVFDVQRRGQGRHLDVSMTHGLHAHLVMPQATAALLAPLLGHRPQAGEDLLNGGLPCYNLYATADDRHLAVGALEFKFWKAACQVFERPDWVNAPLAARPVARLRRSAHCCAARWPRWWRPGRWLTGASASNPPTPA